MKLNRLEFINALKQVQPAIASREVIEQSHSFVFKDNTIYAFNGDVCVSHPFDLEGIECVVVAKELYALLNKIKQQEIDVEITEEGFTIKLAKGKALITLENDIKLPYDELGLNEEKEWEKLPNNFITAVDFVKFTCGNDPNKPQLTCIHIKDSFVTTCDDDRATRYTLTDSMNEMLIPMEHLRNLVKYKPIEYATNTEWVFFRTEEGTVFACTTYAEEYPDIDYLFEQEGSKFTLPEGLSELLEKANIFAKSELAEIDSVDISVSNRKLCVKAIGEGGSYEERIKCKSRAEFAFSINPLMLQECLSLTNAIEYNENVIYMHCDEFKHAVGLLV